MKPAGAQGSPATLPAATAAGLGHGRLPGLTRVSLGGSTSVDSMAFSAPSRTPLAGDTGDTFPRGHPALQLLHQRRRPGQSHQLPDGP